MVARNRVRIEERVPGYNTLGWKKDFVVMAAF
jgi:hypothetical protein